MAARGMTTPGKAPPPDPEPGPPHWVYYSEGKISPRPPDFEGVPHFLPTTPATYVEWSAKARERPCWQCRTWRRWLGLRAHWNCTGWGR